MRTIRNARRPSGFTLIELSMVILIIGILMAFVLAASYAGLESARTRATQALITKLSVGLEERLEALLATSVDANGAHQFLASITPPGVSPGTAPLPWGLYKNTDQRAHVIARLDQIRAEFPDVFYIVPSVTAGGTKGKYPIRFGGLAYPNPFVNPDAGDGNLNSGPLPGQFLPIGNSIAPLYLPDDSYQPGNAFANPGPGAAVGGTGTGVNGASYAAAASLYKLIGYTPRGCDGVDNGNDSSSAFPYVDDYNEGVSDANGAPDADAVVAVDKFLANHTHKTARSEMLYALLVGGLGPLGSVFNPEDFKDNEVKDTDNDGVLEFVDGWGEPLQFFMFPFYHQSDVQKGNALYGAFEVREQSPLDPNNQLTALSWWCDNNSAQTISDKCRVVQAFFGPLYDPNWASGATPQPTAWDRSGLSGRRAYRTRFLILSGGPDRQLGVPMLSDYDAKNPSKYDSYTLGLALYGRIIPGNNGATLIPGESWAMKLDPTNLPPWAQTNPDYAGLDPTFDTSADDISNHGIQSNAGGFQ